MSYTIYLESGLVILGETRFKTFLEASLAAQAIKRTRKVTVVGSLFYPTTLPQVICYLNVLHKHPKYKEIDRFLENALWL